MRSARSITYTRQTPTTRKATRLTPDLVPAALRNCVLLLQQRPTNYRRFGIYWWHVKACLKEAGYTSEHVYMLGDYVDPFTSAMVVETSTIRSLELEEYGFNARYPHADGRVECPNGELVTIYDCDAGV
jgi:hypothetical protein